jgi:hypothetical protein
VTLPPIATHPNQKPDATTARTIGSRVRRGAFRLIVTAMAGALACAMTFVAIAKPAQAQISFTSLMRFSFVHSGKCLDLLGFRVDNGAPVGQWTCNGANNQLWVVRWLGSENFYEVKAFHSNKCLDALGFRTANGSPIGQWDCNGLTNQQWRISFFGPVPGGPVETVLVSRFSNNCLDMRGFAITNGATAVQWDCNGLTNQRLVVTIQA